MATLHAGAEGRKPLRREWLYGIRCLVRFVNTIQTLHPKLFIRRFFIHFSEPPFEAGVEAAGMLVERLQTKVVLGKTRDDIVAEYGTVRKPGFSSDCISLVLRVPAASKGKRSTNFGQRIKLTWQLPW